MCYDKTLKDITTSLQNDSVSKRLVSMLSLFFGVLFFPFIRSTKSCPSSINTIRCITLRHTYIRNELIHFVSSPLSFIMSLVKNKLSLMLENAYNDDVDLSKVNVYKFKITWTLRRHVMRMNDALTQFV